MVSCRPLWMKSVLRKRKPFNVRPLSCTPSVVFFHTTIFTSSRAWGASGFPKQDFWK